MEHPSEEAIPEEFLVVVVDADAGATLKWAGEVDSACADQLAARLYAAIDANVGVVTVDLSQVTFLDASGLRTLAVADPRLQTNGRRLTVCRPSAKLFRVLELSGMAAVLDVQAPAHPSAVDEQPPQRQNRSQRRRDPTPPLSGCIVPLPCGRRVSGALPGGAAVGLRPPRAGRPRPCQSG